MKSVCQKSFAGAASTVALALVVSAGLLALDSAPGAAQETAAVNIVRAPTDLPAPLGRREPATVRVELEAIELVGRLVDGTSYRYWSERPARTPEGGQSLDDAPSK